MIAVRACSPSPSSAAARPEAFSTRPALDRRGAPPYPGSMSTTDTTLEILAAHELIDARRDEFPARDSSATRTTTGAASSVLWASWAFTYLGADLVEAGDQVVGIRLSPPPEITLCVRRGRSGTTGFRLRLPAQ